MPEPNGPRDTFPVVSLAISRELLDQAKAGSPEALNLLYERCAGRLLAFIRLRLGRDLRSRLESRDILQATLLKSLDHVGELKADETRSVMAWLPGSWLEIRVAQISITGSGATRRADPRRRRAVAGVGPVTLRA